MPDSATHSATHQPTGHTSDTLNPLGHLSKHGLKFLKLFKNDDNEVTHHGPSDQFKKCTHCVIKRLSGDSMSIRCIHDAARNNRSHDTIYNDFLRGHRLLKEGAELDCAKNHLRELWDPNSGWMKRPLKECDKICSGLIPPPPGPATSEIPYPWLIFPYRRRNDFI